MEKYCVSKKSSTMIPKQPGTHKFWNISTEVELPAVDVHKCCNDTKNTTFVFASENILIYQ